MHGMEETAALRDRRCDLYGSILVENVTEILSRFETLYVENKQDDIIRVQGNSHGTIPERVPRMRLSSLLSHLAHSPLPLGFRCRL